MQLVTPGIGLVFWMLLSFGILLIILKKFAWKPILGALHKRENTIQESLDMAKQAKEEMAKLKADNQKIIAEAKIERDQLLKEAREIKDNIIDEAKQKAGTEADKIIDAAKKDIENQKAMAINEIKQQVVNLSIDIAEKVLRKQFEDTTTQKKFAKDVLEEVNFN